LRFAMQTERGSGNYAARRHRILGRLSVDELLARMGAAPPNAAGAARGREVVLRLTSGSSPARQRPWAAPPSQTPPSWTPATVDRLPKAIHDPDGV
jgi:hypothetical protein